jgi:hypothetical protein
MEAMVEKTRVAREEVAEAMGGSSTFPTHACFSRSLKKFLSIHCQLHLAAPFGTLNTTALSDAHRHA